MNWLEVSLTVNGELDVYKRQVVPPPQDAFPQKDLSDSVPQAENKTPPPPIPIVMEREEHIFVSPLKKQKERERKRRNALMRFTLVLLLLITVGILFFAPSILPANVRSAIPFLALPINTATPSFTPVSYTHLDVYKRQVPGIG